MKATELAIHGGSRAIERPFKRFNSIGPEEEAMVVEVIKSGKLSSFLGVWSKDFFGGEKVQEFERLCEDFFDIKYAITVNSWTSGLTSAVGAIGIQPGDEVIVTPWTMCATATAILQWNAIPVFADIEAETFCIDPDSVEKNITPYTKAIMAVDIFGHSADIDALKKIADKHNLKLITDTAQAPGTYYKGRKTGTMSDVGGFSLNYHKHIHTGEGGIVVTNDETIAEKVQLIRNHAEAVVEGKGVTDLTNMLGNNFRLGELESAIGIIQLQKLKEIIRRRQLVAHRLNDGLKGLTGLRIPITKEDCTHGYYMYALVIDTEEIGVSRNKIIKALEAEGLTGLSGGYINVHRLPMYQHKIAYGTNGFPWTSEICRRDINYSKGICPTAEKLQDEAYMGFSICLYDLTESDIKAIIVAFKKVWDNLGKLR